MCTNFALIKKTGSVELARTLGIDAGQLRHGENFTPGSLISIVRSAQGERSVEAATWWLYLQQTDAGLRPHKDYFSVNTNHAKLDKKPEYRKSRCIVPATAFAESQDGKNPHLLEPEDGSAIAFGGLCKQWKDKVTGNTVFSASIITLPGHPALKNIHRKSVPLWLPEDALDLWLDDSITDTSAFNELLQPALRKPLKATPINKVTVKNPVGEPFILS